jgi:succinate dehydrogenase / fumarate reductase, cytochrome b subunit
LLNGIRHLFWDMGKGFERRERHASGWIVVIASLALTAGTWAIAARIVRG